MLGKGDMRAVSASGLGPQDREATAFSTEALYYWGFVRLGVAVIAEPRGSDRRQLVTVDSGRRRELRPIRSAEARSPIRAP